MGGGGAGIPPISKLPAQGARRGWCFKSVKMPILWLLARMVKIGFGQRFQVGSCFHPVWMILLL